VRWEERAEGERAGVLAVDVGHALQKLPGSRERVRKSEERAGEE
jgi:predicted metalloprotease